MQKNPVYKALAARSPVLRRMMDEVVSDAKLSETCFQKLGDKLDMALRLLYGGRGGGHGTLQTACQVCHENDDNQQKETQEVCVCVRTRSSFFFFVCV